MLKVKSKKLKVCKEFVTPLNIDITSIEFSNELTGWAGTQYQIYKTTNGGKNWLIQNSTDLGVIYSLWAYNDNLIWGCGNGGRIWHTYRGADTTTSIYSTPTLITENFILNQNFPNPFNSTTIFKFQIKNNGVYKLEIYNSIGQKLKEIFESNFVSGSYEVLFDATNLSSGIYNYKLTGDKNSQTKKFVLIK
ncbi:MAG: T9SS type A sorting domain-containing protein [bacterium]|nr:T9SS type A sorting domain-containing protein [bacterium]